MSQCFPFRKYRDAIVGIFGSVKLSSEDRKSLAITQYNFSSTLVLYPILLGNSDKVLFITSSID